MPHRARSDPSRPIFTVRARPIHSQGWTVEGWHLTVDELPDTWTVAFSAGDIEGRARQRIALDLRCDAEDFDVELVLPAPRVERRAFRRRLD